VKFPKNPEEYSSNWKKMLETLPKPKPKPKHIEDELRRRKADKGDDGIWFDGVDEILLDRPVKFEDASKKLVKANAYTGLTKAVAMDCEMVGVGYRGQDNCLARISIVNHFGAVVYDKYVRATEKVTDYRTFVSGIRPEDLEKKGEDFKLVQKEVSDLLKGRVLVGHALTNDLKVLYLDHPRRNIRDTARYKPFRKLVGGGAPSLKKLTEKLLAVQIQTGEHDSIQDAQAAMRLYTLHRKEWEKSIKQKHRPRSAAAPQQT